MKLPLRYRVALGYGLIGLLLSSTFAIATTFIADDYEEIFVAALLDGQSDAYLDKLQAEPDAKLPHSSGLSLYRAAEAPTALRHLSPGLHEVDLPGHEGVHVGVTQRRGSRLVAVLDVGPIEALEQYLQRLMIVVILGGTVIAAWLGWWVAARALRPVDRLAKAVQSLPVRPLPTGLAKQYSGDTLGALALAIDQYQLMLSEADGKERLFFADASHELRTPIAVIQGAVEVLRDDPDTSALQGAKLDRIDRSLAELTSLLEALLLSARGAPEARERLDLRDTAIRALARLAVLDPSSAQRILISGSPLHVLAPARWVACIVDVLFKKVVGTGDSRWEAAFSTEGLHMFQPTAGVQADSKLRETPIGLGFVFVERLARSLGWELSQEVTPGAGLAVRLRIPATCLDSAEAS